MRWGRRLGIFFNYMENFRPLSLLIWDYHLARERSIATAGFYECQMKKILISSSSQFLEMLLGIHGYKRLSFWQIFQNSKRRRYNSVSIYALQNWISCDLERDAMRIMGSSSARRENCILESSFARSRRPLKSKNKNMYNAKIAWAANWTSLSWSQ